MAHSIWDALGETSAEEIHRVLIEETSAKEIYCALNEALFTVEIIVGMTITEAIYE